MKKIYLYGNWKMNKGIEQTNCYLHDLSQSIENNSWIKRMLQEDTLEIALFPPFISLLSAQKAISSEGLEAVNVKIGSQNLHYEEKGAFTGEVSWSMLTDISCRLSLIGHSERRHLFGESEDEIRKKVKAALDNGIQPVLCYGETLEERQRGETEGVVERQITTALHCIGNNSIIQNIIYAYEPVWAIGTGLAAKPEDAEEVCRYTRTLIETLVAKQISENARILYGGSVKASNAESILTQPDIDGVLVGGASLDVGSFLDIVKPFA